MNVGEFAAALLALGPEVQGYEVWHEADPSSDIQPGDIAVWHDERRVTF